MRRSLAPLIAALAACSFRVSPSAPGDGGPDASGDSALDSAVDGPSSPKRRVKLSFKNGTRNAPLDNFAALVVIDATKVDYSLITPGGANLRFQDGDGTPLDYEIDEWDPARTSYVWVRVPRIDASSDTDFIYMHYGDPALAPAENPAAVWSTQTAVWHLAEDPGPGGAGEIKDSSPAGRHGTAKTAMTSADLVSTVIGKGLHFVGTAGTGVTAAAVALPAYTWSTWIRGETAPVTGSAIHQPLSNGDVNFVLSWDHNQAVFTGTAAQRDASTWHGVSPGALAAMTWYFVTSTYDGVSLCIYVNGGSGSCTPSGAPLAPTGLLSLGLVTNDAAAFKGSMDEVRISSQVVSAIRNNAEYANQRASPASPFVVFGAPEILP